MNIPSECRAAVWAHLQCWRAGRETRKTRLVVYQDGSGWRARTPALECRSGELWANPPPTHFKMFQHPITSLKITTLKSGAFHYLSWKAVVFFTLLSHGAAKLGESSSQPPLQGCLLSLVITLQKPDRGSVGTCIHVRTLNKTKFRGWGRRNANFLKSCMPSYRRQGSVWMIYECPGHSC